MLRPKGTRPHGVHSRYSVRTWARCDGPVDARRGTGTLTNAGTSGDPLHFRQSFGEYSTLKSVSTQWELDLHSICSIATIALSGTSIKPALAALSFRSSRVYRF